MDYIKFGVLNGVQSAVKSVQGTPEYTVKTAKSMTLAIVSMIALFALGAIGSYIHRTMGPERLNESDQKTRLYYQVFPALVGGFLAGTALYKAQKDDLKSIAGIVALSVGCFEYQLCESWGIC